MDIYKIIRRVFQFSNLVIMSQNLVFIAPEAYNDLGHDPFLAMKIHEPEPKLC